MPKIDTQKIRIQRDVPGDLGTKTPHSQCRGPGSSPQSRD